MSISSYSEPKKVEYSKPEMLKVSSGNNYFILDVTCGMHKK
jgi:hypothetical protein